MSEETLNKCSRIFDGAGNKLQSAGIDYTVIASAMVSTAVSAVMQNDGAEEAARWLREIADNIEGAEIPKH